MSRVVQMAKSLSCQPQSRPVVGFRLRAFEDPGDLPAWLVLRQAAFARERLGVRAWDVSDFRHEFSAKPWWNPAHCWVVEPESYPGEPGSTPNQPPDSRVFAQAFSADQPLVGSVTLAMRSSDEVDRAVVHWLMVPPRYRTLGLGRWLLSVLEEQAWQLGHREVFLETHAAWEAATRFYQAAGYQAV